MKKLTPDSPEAKSLDLIGANIAKLKALFPELLTEGKDGAAVNVDVLMQLVGDATATDTDEKYGLTWNGKRKARLEALKPSTGTLRPAKDDSVEWDSTQNLVIEGDNLEVLKLLQKSYANQVKLIYIDPPYNTGKDFVYPDDYQDNLRNYKERQGTLGVEQNAETSGRYHTDWLNMLYPRLIIAKTILHPEGLMIIHMDEHEQANAEKLLAEIFGEDCVLGVAVWDKRNPKGDATGLAYQHESVLFVAKDADKLAVAGGLSRRKKNADAILSKAAKLFSRIGKEDLPADLKEVAKDYKLARECTSEFIRPIGLAEVNEEFESWIKAQNFSGGEEAYSMIDENGEVYQSVSMAWPNKKQAPEDYFIPLKHPVTKEDCPVPARGWRNPPATMEKLLVAGEILFGSDHTTQPRRKYLLKKNMNEILPSVLSYGGSDDALLKEMGIPFEHPKPVGFARELITTIKGNDAVVVDFFAGSGTTGHAVMAQNATDGGTRRYFLVQLDEPLNSEKKEQKVAAEFCDKLGKPRTIAELTKERLRRAAKKVKAENPLFHGDLGFRVFKLDTSNLKAWDPNTNTVREDLLSVAEHVKPDRSNDDLLYELLLKKGLDLAVPMEQKTIAGQVVHAIGGGVMLACLADAIDTKVAEPLALGIAEWHKQLAPANDKETVVVFKDSAFDSNVAKSNLTEILKQRGLEKVNSI
ncbi:MAG: site-specific DNA-methyltransferase [Flavobacteriales bacterium]|nr:site-specific DNA-methyltransferase [Flavobacteriales bacterium]